MGYRIKMELLSDLCPASGESLAGVIDTEIKFDDYGFPYIPAKRIKGCLRESAIEIKDLLGENFDDKSFNRLFGEVGSSIEGNLKIYDGYLEGYKESFKDFLKIINDKNEKKYKPLLKREYIKEMFTSTRTQTKISSQTGTAEDGSLRVLRVINKGNIFYFDLNIDGENNSEVELLSKCCKVLRRVGLNRTRGYGEVSCELEVIKNEDDNSNIEDIKDNDFVDYIIELQSQTIISSKGSQSTQTLDYIPGANILGYFASRYLKLNSDIDKHYAHNDDKFRALFLDDDLIFSNAYITLVDSEDNYMDFFPCPASIVREKNSDNFFNKVEYITDEDKPMSKIQGTYISFDEYDDVYFNKAITELEYHHKRHADRTVGRALGNTDKEENGGEFYQYHVLKKGQIFKGRIQGSKEKLNEIVKIIPKDSIINIGRSKTSQYAKASIKVLNTEVFDEKDKDITFKKNDTFIVHLISPMILLNKFGHYEPNIDLLKEKLEAQFNEPKSLSIEKQFLKFKTMSGFNSKWMLPKENVLTIDSGTIIKLQYNGNKEFNKSIIEKCSYGKRINEGYGKIKIYKEMTSEPRILDNEFGTNYSYNNSDFLNSIMKRNLEKMVINELKDKAVQYTESYFEKKKINASNSFIYKTKILLEESIDIYEFLNKMKELRDKQSQTKKVDQIISYIFNDYDLSKKIISDFKNNTISNFYNNEHKNIKRDLLEQLLLKEYLLDEDDLLEIKDINIQNKFIKIYYSEIINQIKLATRKG